MWIMFDFLIRWHVQYMKSHCSKFFFLNILFLLVLERGREGEREGNINVWLSLERSLLGTWPATQSCALIGN